MAAASARFVTADGELTSATPSVLQQRIIDLEHELADAEKDLRHKRRRIAALESDKQRERDEAPERKLIEAIFLEWQTICGKGRSKLTPDRFDAIRTRVQDGYSPQQFSLAIAGANYDPFITTARNGKQTRHNDIELICRDGKRFEGFANKAPKATARETNTNADDGAQTALAVAEAP